MPPFSQWPWEAQFLVAVVAIFITLMACFGFLLWKYEWSRGAPNVIAKTADAHDVETKP